MLSQKQIARNREFVRRTSRMSDLSDPQQRALSMICYIRHMMHAKIRDPYGTYLRNFFLRNMPILLNVSGLPELDLREIYRRYGSWEGKREEFTEALNRIIEDWLWQIDIRYGTAYAPKGGQRGMREQKLQKTAA